MKIYDCFLYNNEDEILGLRLNILSKNVDYFVIVESKYTHSGIKKSFNFDIKKFEKFKDKIIYLKFNDFVFSADKVKQAWLNENLQRNYIYQGLVNNNAKSDDKIIISDIDEIPNLENIRNFLNKKILVFKQRSFIYKYNYCEKLCTWMGSKMCNFSNLKSPQWLRSLKLHKKYSLFRIDKLFFSKSYERSFYVIENGGWHFSWIGNIEYIKKKILSTAHIELNTEKNLNSSNIENKICEIKAINLDDQTKYEKVEINSTLLPPFLVENLKHYIHNFDH